MKFCLTLAAMVMFHLGVAQHLKFVPGKVVLNNGDTIRGVISYGTEEQLHQRFEFRREGQSETEELGATDVMGFSIVGESLRLFRSARNLTYNMINNEPNIVDAFIEVKIDGAVSLGRMVDSANEEHLFLTKEGTAYELVNKVTYIVDDGGQKLKKRDLGYTGLLSITLGDCGYKGNYPTYSYINFERLVIAYNNCRNSPVTKYVSKRRTNYFGFNVGYSVTQVTLHDAGYVFPGYYSDAGNQLRSTDAKYEIVAYMDDNVMVSSFPLMSLYFNSVSVRNRHLSMSFELMPMYTEFKTAVIDDKSLSIALPFAAKYAFLLAEQCQPYLAVGANPSLAVSTTTNSVTTARHLDYTTGLPLVAFTNDESSPIGYKQLPYGITFTSTLGIDYYLPSSDRIQAGFRYELGTGTMTSKPVTSTRNVFNFFVGYSWSKSARRAVAALKAQ